MKSRISMIVAGLLVAGMAMAQQAEIDRYNVEWDTPSENSAGSMPLGNGELGANLWVEKNGDLLFYLSRTDAISEANRLMKMGRVRVSLSPNPFREGLPFSQQLVLKDGAIYVTAGKDGEAVKFSFLYGSGSGNSLSANEGGSSLSGEGDG